MTPPRLVVRADADPELGLGHLARAVALAEVVAERTGAEPVLVGRATPVLVEFLAGRQATLEPLLADGYGAEQIAELLDRHTLLVSDTAELDEQALQAVAATGARHVAIDDFGRHAAWPCDVVVNPNLGVTQEYAGARRVLVGPRYALLRREIVAAAASARGSVPARARRLLVCFGGGTWSPPVARLLAALAPLADDGVEIRATIDERVPDGINAVPRATLPEQLAWADAALLSGGVVKYEAAACGVPSLLVAVVPHQETISELFAARGAAEYLGPAESIDLAATVERVRGLLASGNRRETLARAGRSLVDGRGAQRVADALLQSPWLDT